ncbi:substrate-binding periplasmic protein [Terrabacter sp. GCM10028922]|uniref:substrate-binding periplasmic protein n=1 Tax=Terrabacter sp. GCM10028922 TaxID=3273428 RepID=UPI003621212D
MRTSMTHRVAVSATATALALLLAACGADGAAAPGSGADGAAAAAAELDTISPGVIKVAIQPYMPYTGSKAGKLEGLDSQILEAVAGKLGLMVEPQVTDFNGMLGNVQSRRVDISIGGIAWTKERAAQGLFTDPPYYSPPALATHGGKKINTVDDLKDLRLGTVTGYVWAKSIKAVPGSQPHTYPDANGVFADIGSGRLDAGFLDPLLITYTQAQRPDLGIETQYMQAPTAEQVKASPDYAYFQPYMTGFYLPKDAPKLEKAISQQIDAMYASGEMATLISKWGGDPAQFLKPAASMTEERRAVDRPASWSAPSAP